MIATRLTNSFAIGFKRTFLPAFAFYLKYLNILTALSDIINQLSSAIAYWNIFACRSLITNLLSKLDMLCMSTSFVFSRIFHFFHTFRLRFWKSNKHILPFIFFCNAKNVLITDNSSSMTDCCHWITKIVTKTKPFVTKVSLNSKKHSVDTHINWSFKVQLIWVWKLCIWN